MSPPLLYMVFQNTPTVTCSPISPSPEKCDQYGQHLLWSHISATKGKDSRSFLPCQGTWRTIISSPYNPCTWPLSSHPSSNQVPHSHTHHPWERWSYQSCYYLPYCKVLSLTMLQEMVFTPSSSTNRSRYLNNNKSDPRYKGGDQLFFEFDLDWVVVTMEVSPDGMPKGSPDGQGVGIRDQTFSSPS